MSRAAGNPPARTILLVACGGTIASTYDAERPEKATVAGGEALLGLLDPADLPRDMEIAVENRLKIQGSQITLLDMLQVVHRIADAATDKTIDGIVVTHGTTTLTDTAFVTDLFCPPGPPVVFTGAMRSADSERGDGPANLANALRIAASPEAAGRGVLVCLAGAIHAARHAVKVHASAPRCLASPAWGAVGHAGNGGVTFHRKSGATSGVLTLPPRLDLDRIVSDVEVIGVTAGANEKLLVLCIDSGPAGLVIETFPGEGGVPRAFVGQIRRAIEAMPVVLTTRAPLGRVSPTARGASYVRDLAEMGVIFAPELTADKARLLLISCLYAGLDGDSIRGVFARVAS